MSDLYAAGAMDRYIRTRHRAGRSRRRALPPHQQGRAAGRLAADLRSSASTAARSARPSPPIGTARRSAYQCLPDFVTWAQGCGNEGRIAPFGGRAKLPWNLDWAAQWSHFGVTIEGCGKDLATAGGSRDRSDAIAREVFEREPPRNVPYEFLNIGGRKMSTSKGRGAAAHTIAEVVPPEQLRFLFLRPAPEPGHRVRPRRLRRDPAPVRRVRPDRRGDGRPRGEGRAAPESAARAGALAGRPRTPTSTPRRRCSGRRSATSRCSSRCPAWMSRG